MFHDSSDIDSFILSLHFFLICEICYDILPLEVLKVSKEYE